MEERSGEGVGNQNSRGWIELDGCSSRVRWRKEGRNDNE